MERDHKSEITFHVIRPTYGYAHVLRIPPDAGGINGICRYRDLLLITTTEGRLFTLNELNKEVNEIKMPTREPV